MEHIKISFETDDRKISYELPWDASMEQMLDAFYSGCIGLTWVPSTIINAMSGYASERLNTTD